MSDFHGFDTSSQEKFDYINLYYSKNVSLEDTTFAELIYGNNFANKYNLIIRKRAVYIPLLIVYVITLLCTSISLLLNETKFAIISNIIQNAYALLLFPTLHVNTYLLILRKFELWYMTANMLVVAICQTLYNTSNSNPNDHWLAYAWLVSFLIGTFSFLYQETNSIPIEFS